MGKLISLMVSLLMYLLWIATVVMAVAAVFTDFKYEDVNIIAGLLVIFSLLNSFFILVRKHH